VLHGLLAGAAFALLTGSPAPTGPGDDPYRASPPEESALSAVAVAVAECSGDAPWTAYDLALLDPQGAVASGALSSPACPSVPGPRAAATAALAGSSGEGVPLVATGTEVVAPLLMGAGLLTGGLAFATARRRPRA
jgi:hypothetical protein